MAKFETFSKRQKRLEGKDNSEIYEYDNLPTAFRNQIVHIWHDALGIYLRREPFNPRKIPVSNMFWTGLHDIIAREAGLTHLGQKAEDVDDRCISYLLTAKTDGALDIIEMSFRMIERFVPTYNGYDLQYAGVRQNAKDAIEELNARFKEHGLGYSYENGILIRVNSEYLHTEAVLPALKILHEEEFKGASNEFLSAQIHYRNGEYKDAILDAENAFESVMKTICEIHNWSAYQPDKDTASTLIDHMVKLKLIPEELKKHFVETLPRIRNKFAGHGQGTQVKDAPEYLASYALHLAASNIVFLVEANRAITKK